MAGNYLESETPHFFKVILQEDIQKNSLMVPRKFVRKYGKNLSSFVHLKVPTGDALTVELERNDNGGLSLRKGWADFMDRYCIRFGYFLVFRYEGDSRFHVVVFDVTACEIEYPAGISKRPCPANGRPISSPDTEKAGEEIVHSVESSDDEDLNSRTMPALRRPFSTRGVEKADEKVVRVIEEMSHVEGFDTNPNGGRREKPLSFCPRRPKKMRTESQVTDRSASGHSSPERTGFTEGAVSAKESGAFLRASSFHCKGPSTIVVIRSLLRLYLPKPFMMTCFPGIGKYSDIKVCLSDGRNWTFRIGKERRYPRFGCGWNKFVVDNNLGAGDVCLFELIESSKVQFRIFIFREDGVEHPRPSSTRQRNSSQENAARESASHEGSRRLNDSVKLDSESEIRDPYPFFRVVVSKSYGNQPLYIKKSFAERHLKEILGEVNVNGTLECGGNSWPCKLCRYESQDRQQTVLRGWQEFHRQNGFKVGDALLFQLLIRKNDFVFRVYNLSFDLCERLKRWV